MSLDLPSIKQEFVVELESILESDGAYGSNLQILTYTLKEDVINGKFKDSWNNRVYEFIIDIDGISYKPAAKLDSFNADELPARFDAYSKGYSSLLKSGRFDRNLTGKRVKKPKCGKQGYGCGYSCISLLKTCQILSSGKKAGTNQGKAIGQQRLNKLMELSKKLYLAGDTKKAALASTIAANIQSTRANYTKGGAARMSERALAEQPKEVHDFIPSLDNPQRNFKHPEVIDKISAVTGMTKSEVRASTNAVNAFTERDYEKIRKADYAGKSTLQIAAINRYLDKMPKFPGEIFRGKNFKTKQDLDSFIGKLQEGHSYEIPAMSSFSSDMDTALLFSTEGALGRLDNSVSAVVFKVTSNKSGVTVKHLSSNPEEDEVLVKKGARYKINGAIGTVTRYGSGRQITIIPLKEY